MCLVSKVPIAQRVTTAAAHHRRPQRPVRLRGELPSLSRVEQQLDRLRQRASCAPQRLYCRLAREPHRYQLFLW